nr:immunoglobulin light chain junction region [Macaca mulatta]MPN96152.1 immunoglobulin light chain junction region [Macaca mulatta]MPN99621.1 immunoglobulin light chain junction region [Macaca mulatta]
CMQPLQTPCTF